KRGGQPEGKPLRSNQSSRQQCAFSILPLVEGRSGNEAYCSREDSNLHGFPHTVLSRTRLPIPPREQQAAALRCARTRRPARLNQRHCDWNEARDIWLN